PCDLFMNSRNVHIPSFRICVNEDSFGSSVFNGVDRCYHGESGKNDLAAPADPQCNKRQMESRSSTISRDAKAGLAEMSELVLELTYEWAQRAYPGRSYALRKIL